MLVRDRAGRDLVVPGPGLSTWIVEYGDRITMTVEITAERKDKVATPQISASGANITLTCATSGAAVYYTTDESFPGPGNDEALLYSTPFTLASGTHLLRVAGHKAGSACSDAVMAELTVA